MNKKLNNIFSETDCISSEKMIFYIENKLSAEERFLVEKHLIDCEFCSEAIEGQMLVNDKSKLQKVFTDINTEIDKITSKKKHKTHWFDFKMKLAAAAMIIVILSITFLLKDLLVKQKNDMLAETTVKESAISDKEAKEVENNINNPKSSEENVLKYNDLIDQDKSKVKEVEEQITSENNRLESKTLLENDAFISSKTDAPQTLKSGKDETGMLNIVDADKLEKTSIKKNNNIATEQSNTAVGGSLIKTQSVTPVQTDSKMEYKSISQQKSQEKNKKNESKKKDDNVTKPKSNITYAETTAIPTMNDEVSKEESDIIKSDNIASNKKLYIDGVKKYQSKDYAKCKEIMGSYLSELPNDYNALFYSGASSYFLNNFDNAIIMLNKVLKNKDADFYSIAQWYIALSYIGSTKNSKAIKVLEEIVSAKGEYKTQAEDKLLELK